MSAARAIRRGIENPGLISYFAVAVASALIVLAVTGYRAHPAAGTLNDMTALTNTRLLTAEAGVAAPASSAVDPVDQSNQVVGVYLDENGVSPDQVSVRAGIPSTLVFCGGSGCASSISFGDLGAAGVVDRDGTVQVKLPPLAPGVYAYSCDAGCVTGVLLAE